MSRIGKMPIPIPVGVEVKQDGFALEIKGPKGVLQRKFSPNIDIKLEEGTLIVTRRSDMPEERSLHGLTRALLANMITGVTSGFEKRLVLTGVGYRAAINNGKLALTVGKSHPVEMDPGSDLKVAVPQPNTIIISGIDKERVGAFAANVRATRPPEPYKGKGIRYANEVIKRKAGKAGAK